MKEMIWVMNIETRKKNSLGLHDDTSESIDERYALVQPIKIFRNQQNYKNKVVSLQKVKLGILPPPLFDFFGSVNTQEHRFTFCRPLNIIQPLLNQLLAEQPSETYLVLRFKQSTNIYELNEGDLLKFGRIIFYVKDLSWSYQQSQESYEITNSIVKRAEILTQKRQFHGTCRICLSDEQQFGNFMVSICQCKGSCELIHLQCLKEWVRNKIKIQQSNTVITYDFSRLTCQICDSDLPKAIMYKDQSYYIFTIKRPRFPFIILESVGDHNQNVIHLINLKNYQRINIGRSWQNQLRIPDISVSRRHAQIIFINGRYYLGDLNSRFGTLIRLRNKVQIQKNTIIQSGRNVYTFRNCQYINKPRKLSQNN